jgi:hypothetical protein
MHNNMPDVSNLLEALAEAARTNRKDEFDRLERELLSNFEGGFDGMPELVHQSYLEIDRLWPVVPVGELDRGSSSVTTDRRRVVRVNLTAADEAWLRHAGSEADRSVSAVLSICLRLIREDADLGNRVVELLRDRHEER